MHRSLVSLNDGKSLTTFRKEFNLKDMIWTLARAWERVTPSTLKNGWHKLWPALMFEDSPDINDESEFTGFQVSENQKTVSELMEYASGMSHPVVLELAKGLGEENLLDWMEVDKNAPIASQMTDEEIFPAVPFAQNKDN
ncbi:unnamed protein product [Caretta caretta]